MTIRPATVDDVDAITALEASIFGADAWSAGSVREELTGARRTAVVACDPDVVGYAIVAVAGDATDLQRVAVEPSRRREGLGHALLTVVLPEEAQVLLEVSTRNEAALAFYDAEGFATIDRRPSYYRDGADALVMQRETSEESPHETARCAHSGHASEGTPNE
jgi:[ribosomal protein S18]-alanine N-acetyltransferase